MAILVVARRVYGDCVGDHSLTGHMAKATQSKAAQKNMPAQKSRDVHTPRSREKREWCCEKEGVACEAGGGGWSVAQGYERLSRAEIAHALTYNVAPPPFAGIVKS